MIPPPTHLPGIFLVLGIKTPIFCKKKQYEKDKETPTDRPTDRQTKSEIDGAKEL